MKVGIIGTGKIAKTMVKTIAGMSGVECYAVSSRSLERADMFAKDQGVTKAYGSYEAMLEDPEVDLVYVATPHSEHYKHAKLCIEHGKPSLVEKPFTVNAKEAKEILELAKEKQVFITEAIWTRYMPSRKMINEIIESGEIGEVTAIDANLGYRNCDLQRMKDPALAGGALLDLGVYPLNFASMIMGNHIKKTVSHVKLTDLGVDEQNVMILEYESGAVATLRSTMLSDTDQTGYVYGTDGYLLVNNINNVTDIEVYGKRKKLKNTLRTPGQITGYEYEVQACKKALEEGKLYCEEMPHEDTLALMEQMDSFRADWGIRYPFE